MKVFVIVHNLVADSGHIITVVQAKNKAEAFSKYRDAFPDRYCLGASVEEVTRVVQEVYRYDNPNYEG